MIETLGNLRNNRIKADATSSADASVSLKKFLANLAKQRSRAFVVLELLEHWR
jgi:hypothetical protein